MRIQSREAASILGISQRTAQTLALRGELPGVARIGRVWTFDVDKLAAYVTQRERDAERLDVAPPPKPTPRRATRTQVSTAYAKLMAGRNSYGAAAH
jgi:hypothetical protein